MGKNPMSHYISASRIPMPYAVDYIVGSSVIFSSQNISLKLNIHDDDYSVSSFCALFCIVVYTKYLEEISRSVEPGDAEIEQMKTS
jgi:hypothetical protein